MEPWQWPRHSPRASGAGPPRCLRPAHRHRSGRPPPAHRLTPPVPPPEIAFPHPHAAEYAGSSTPALRALDAWKRSQILVGSATRPGPDLHWPQDAARPRCLRKLAQHPGGREEATRRLAPWLSLGGLGNIPVPVDHRLCGGLHLVDLESQGKPKGYSVRLAGVSERRLGRGAPPP